MERLEERLTVARRAWVTLAEVLREPRSPIIRDASIQRFEYTFEAIWKAAQLYLREIESLDVGSPKAAIRASLQTGLLSEKDAREALAMADDRNLTVHTYNEDLADQIYSRLAPYSHLLDRWLAAMSEKAP